MSQEQVGGGDTPLSKQDWTRFLRPRVLITVFGVVLALLIVLAVGIYIWKAASIRRLEARMAAERSESTSAQRQALTMQARDLLRLTVRPLAWAVRAELMRDNLSQIDDYFREFVRERGVTSLLLVGKDGRITLATNRKLETQSAESFVSKVLLEKTELAFEESGATIRFAVPIMGLDSRLGTLIVDYDTQAK